MKQYTDAYIVLYLLWTHDGSKAFYHDIREWKNWIWPPTIRRTSRRTLATFSTHTPFNKSLKFEIQRSFRPCGLRPWCCWCRCRRSCSGRNNTLWPESNRYRRAVLKYRQLQWPISFGFSISRCSQLRPPCLRLQFFDVREHSARRKTRSCLSLAFNHQACLWPPWTLPRLRTTATDW